jgi:hypothetical protein
MAVPTPASMAAWKPLEYVSIHVRWSTSMDMPERSVSITFTV